MVFGTRLINAKNKAKCDNSRSKSVDSGVSVPLSKTYKALRVKSSDYNINDLEEQLDFEPDFEDDFSSSCELDQPQRHTFSDHSTVKDLNLNYSEEADSTYSETVDNCSISNVSVGHISDMLPVPQINAGDGRQHDYLPLRYTPSLSARTTLDSSSEDDSDETNKFDFDAQNNVANNHHKYQSGNENGENSSTCSLSQEEEDKLLYSSEEESQDNLLIQPDLVQTCQIGNARITLPTFVDSAPKGQQTNDLKRTKSSAKLNVLEYKKKRKKWDVSFKPEHPITRVFLNDIGYVSDGGDSAASETCSSLSDPPLRSLLVICNKDKIVCEEPGAKSERTVEDNFKLPLPPPKRPPSRPKRTVCKSPEAGKNLQIKFSHKESEFSPRTQSSGTLSRNLSVRGESLNSEWDKDDSISIIASTIGDNNDVADTSCLEDSLQSDEPTESFEHPVNLNSIENRVKQWVQSVPNPVVLNNIPNQVNVTSASPPNNAVVSQPAGNENVTGSPPSNPTLIRGNARINYKDVPVVFTGLCYYYYLKGICTRHSHCTLMHVVQTNKFVRKFEKADPQYLFNAYQWAKSYNKLYKEIYPAFVKAFGQLKMRNELIACIKDFLQMEEKEATDAIALVVSAFEETGLAFHEAIETISFNIGFFEHALLADILLDLVIRRYEMSENWEVIKRITKARGKIKPSIVKRMLTRATSVYPVNKKLCLDIYDLFIKNNMTDLSQIDEDILAPYRTLVGFHDATASTIQTSPKTSNPQLRPMTIPDHQELLAAHIDNNLIRERERYEREVEGTTIKAKVVHNRNLNQELNYPSRIFNSPNVGSCSGDTRSRSSGSEEQYFMPHTMSPFGRREDFLLRDNVFSHTTPSVSSSPFDLSSNCVDLDAALNFQPPSPPAVSEYVPQNVTVNDQRSEEVTVTLMPSKPIFGRPSYRSNFSFEKSLHNLLPDAIEHVSINERDVVKLNCIIKKKDGPEFYKLLQYYINPPTLENFITMTIVNLKSCNNICETLKELLRSFESIKPDYAKDRKIKAIIEVVVMNLLFELEKKGQWNRAKDLLQLFSDWDSLVSSKIFSKRRVTHMGRYIFLAKIFAKAKNFYLTYEILQCPTLKLLESPECWPYFKNAQVDLEYRNAVLNEFFAHAHHYYIAGVSDLYRRMYKYGGIYQFDARHLFNPTLTALINEHQASSLKYFLSDVDIYYKIMDKNLLRAFTLVLAPDIPQESAFKLYKLCCERQIYVNFSGNETNIAVNNNMSDVELQLILNNFFYKLLENRKLPNGNVTISIKVMDNRPHYPKMLQQCIRSIKEVNESVKRILKNHLNVTLFEGVTEQLTTIEIRLEHLTKWLQCNHRWFPIYA